jgi:hypothetical protein
MVTDRQVRRLRHLRQRKKSLAAAAAMSGMSEKTARRYERLGQLPSETKPERTWRTRPDAFCEVWSSVEDLLRDSPGLEAKTIFEYLRREHEETFRAGQLRTLQRRIKQWRALHGPGREVFFPQVHRPGELAASDFTSMNELGIRIGGEPFAHLFYHFVLTYSNWETGTIALSESFESLSEGLQSALRELGGVPEAHRTDRLTPAVHQMDHPEEFTARYRGLLAHYELKGQAIQAGQANENGDVEQRHHRFKRAVEQALLLRGSREFESRAAYGSFLREVCARQNRGREERFAEEVAVLRPLPAHGLSSSRRVEVSVRPTSTIQVVRNTYSVHSRLIGEQVTARVKAEEIEIWYGQRCVDRFPRLRGERKHRIDYRHVIGWLVRKPGAFANYRYREEMFPTTRFRSAYDVLCEQQPARAAKEYVTILELAARTSELRVDAELDRVLREGGRIDAGAIARRVNENEVSPMPEVEVHEVDLGCYDGLYNTSEEVPACAAAS